MDVVRFSATPWRFAVLALLVVVLGCAGPDAASTDDASTEEAVQAYFDAWNTRDIDQIMSHVAEGASLEIDPIGVMWDTHDDMRAAFDAMFAKSEWTVEVSDFEGVDDDTVTYNFEIFNPEGVRIDSGRSEATVENGLIKAEQAIGMFREER